MGKSQIFISKMIKTRIRIITLQKKCIYFSHVTNIIRVDTRMLKKSFKISFRQDRCVLSQSPGTACPHSHSPRRLTGGHYPTEYRQSCWSECCSLLTVLCSSTQSIYGSRGRRPELKLRHDTTTSKFHSFLHSSDSYEKYAKVVGG